MTDPDPLTAFIHARLGELPSIPIADALRRVVNSVVAQYDGIVGEPTLIDNEYAEILLRDVGYAWRLHDDYRPEWAPQVDHSPHHRHTRGSRIECECGAYGGLVTTSREPLSTDVCRVCRAPGVMYLDG